MSVLLITSRETKRWILPKGNFVKGLTAHASAAYEAEEEAGIIGAACPTPLGSYRYRKKRKNGASLMATVDVYPIAVLDVLDDWDEKDERERRWFSLADAAEAVSEPDLKELILNFRASESDRAIATGFSRDSAKDFKKGFKMFHWFQALLPKQGNFFAMFEAHAVTLNHGSDALVRLLQGGPGMADHIREIIEREHEADAIIQDVLNTVRQTFLTPFDRSAIISLINAMDDAIDQMHKTAAAISLYEVKEFDPEMRDMAAIIVDAARVTSEALPLLRNIAANAPRLNELTERLVQMEGQADDIHDLGLKKLFHEHGASNPLHFMISREIYSHLEKVVDRFEDVANEINGLVIDHA